MAFLGLFQRPQPTTPAAYEPRTHAPGTRIGYDPMLPQTILKEHQRLMDLLADIQTLHNTTDYAGVHRLLAEFRILMQEHLLNENVKVYVYLSRQLASKEGTAAVLAEIRRKVFAINREIMDFVRRFTEMRVNELNADVFQAELLQIGALLVQHIEREESTLLPLYLPQYR